MRRADKVMKLRVCFMTDWEREVGLGLKCERWVKREGENLSPTNHRK